MCSASLQPIQPPGTYGQAASQPIRRAVRPETLERFAVRGTRADAPSRVPAGSSISASPVDAKGIAVRTPRQIPPTRQGSKHLWQASLALSTESPVAGSAAAGVDSGNSHQLVCHITLLLVYYVAIAAVM